MGVFQRTNVERRSFWSPVRFQGFFSSNQRLRLKGTFSFALRRRISLRRTSSTASLRCLTMWNRSNRIWAWGACSFTRLAYAAHISPQMTWSVGQRRPSHFFGEERPDRLLGPVVAHPHKNTRLQIVNHREIDLALAPAHLIDPDHV